MEYVRLDFLQIGHILNVHIPIVLKNYYLIFLFVYQRCIGTFGSTFDFGINIYIGL